MLYNGENNVKIYYLGRLKTTNASRAGVLFDVLYKRVDTIGRLIGYVRADNQPSRYLGFCPSYIPVNIIKTKITDNYEYNIYIQIEAYTTDIKINLSSELNFEKNVHEVNSVTGSIVDMNLTRLENFQLIN